jgi:hypothetical protein
VHKGDICLNGTTCNLDVSAEGERRLGEYITVALDPSGRLIAATADTMLKNPLGGTKSVSNPLFLKQTGGPKLYR